VNEVDFSGSWPYHLPPAQHTKASSLNGSVEVRLYGIIEGELRPIVFQIVSEKAEELAYQLLAAAKE
jgi:hypothetical protein